MSGQREQVIRERAYATKQKLPPMGSDYLVITISSLRFHLLGIAHRIILSDVLCADRYVIRPTDEPDCWCVWDTHRDAVVFGGEDLSESKTRVMAQRLNDGYRRSLE